MNRRTALAATAALPAVAQASATPELDECRAEIERLARTAPTWANWACWWISAHGWTRTVEIDGRTLPSQNLLRLRALLRIAHGDQSAAQEADLWK